MQPSSKCGSNKQLPLTPKSKPMAKPTPRPSGPASTPQPHAAQGQAGGLSVAAGRRKRRRMLAESFASGERAFGDAEDPEQLQRFVARGLSSGGRAGQVAVEAIASGQAALGTAWPLNREGYRDVFSLSLWRRAVDLAFRCRSARGAKCPFSPCASTRTWRRR